MTIDVEIEDEAQTQIKSLARESIDGRETGGILLGRGPRPDDRVVHVDFAGDPGPTAERRPDFFLRDLEHARRLAAHGWSSSQSVWVGEWHTHPHGDPRPSPTDLATYSELLAAEELQFDVLVAIIVIAGPGDDWNSPSLVPWVFATNQTKDVDHDGSRPPR
ncbi:MAG: Mov34/MPN/PAD-1 family protein [Solirubrobacterales bacterium]|nr:Mov34/MPN/PAD-1 family protein [Solirubrobacterales bacterium]